LKVFGIFMALTAVYMTTHKKDKSKRAKGAFWLPVILFLGSGFLDAFLKYNESELVPVEDQAWFAASIFALAGILGLILVLDQVIRKKEPFPLRSVLGGLALGIPNYGSIYFLLRALSMENNESSNIFALNNVGVVALSAVLGFFFFKEKLSPINLAGIILAITSIVLIALGL
jgi:drug/metabolite transporter (DMT)-like permease